LLQIDARDEKSRLLNGSRLLHFRVPAGGKETQCYMGNPDQVRSFYEDIEPAKNCCLGRYDFGFDKRFGSRWFRQQGYAEREAVY
jgi:hypothetical protein